MRIPNSGQCFPGKLDYNAAQSVFVKQDVDKNGNLNFGGVYAALTKLEPKATEEQLSKLTNDPKTGLLHKGKVSYITFLQMYRTLHAETHATGNTNPCAKNPCSKGQTCKKCKNPLGFCCTVIVTDTPNSVKLTKSERAQVNNIFTALNTDHASKTLSKEEFSALLDAVTEDLDRTHNIKLYKSVSKTILSADTNDNGVVDYVEFVKACTALKKADAKDFHEFLKSAETLKPLKIGSVCVPSKESANSKACPKGSTCQQAPIPKGSKTTVRRFTCKKDVPLSKSEKAQAGNIFRAMDVDHNNKLSHVEMYSLLRVIRTGLNTTSPTYHEAYEAITRSVYYNADANSDKFIEKSEFYTAMMDLKNADPTDFKAFLKAGHILYPLKIGNTCLPFKPVGEAKPCPSSSTCQIKQTATTKPAKAMPYGVTPTPSQYKCVKNKALTNDEKKQVSNIFTALDSNHDGKLAHYGELYTLLRTVRTTFPYYSPEYQTISHSVYYDADVNKDGYVTKQEFSAAVTTLKNANPMGFPSFLKACEKLKPLHIGAKCQPSKYSYNYQACPKGSTCQMKANKKPAKGATQSTATDYVCIKDVTLTSREKAQAGNVFHALDTDHSKNISRTEMSDLLHVVSDWSQENNNHNLYLAVDRSVYTSYSDTNRDGVVSQKEFLAGVQKLKNMDPKDFPQFLQLAKKLRPLKIGQECKPYRSGKNDGACPAHSTCQVDLKAKNTTTRVYKCAKDLALTKSERKRAFNLFTALDAKHQKKLDSSEMSRMLQAIRSSLDVAKYSALLEAVSRGTYFYQDDVNKDKYIEFGEFINAITSVKNRDPKDFAVFLNAAKSIKPLKTGSVCRPNGAGDACPKGNTCQLTQKASGRRVYFAQPRQRQLQGVTTFGPPSYTAPKYLCKKDVSLSSDQRKKAIALFHAMDKSNDNKLSSTEYSGLMHQVYTESGKTHDYSLQTAIYESVYYTVSDTNKDHLIEINEFIAGITKLKNRDPQDFPTFMKIAAQLKTLKSGQECSTSYFATETCPPGTKCTRGSNGKYSCVKFKKTTEDPFAFPILDGDIVHVHG